MPNYRNRLTFDSLVTPPGHLPDLMPISITSFPHVFRRLTLALTCCRKPERRRSGGWRQSGASPCWALELARACALVTPPAVFPPRPPQDDVSAPREPTAWPDTPTSRRCRGRLDTASGPSASRYPPATRRVPPGAPHEGHPLLRPAHAATPRSSTAGRHQAWRDGSTTRSCATGTPHGRAPRRGTPARAGRAPSRVGWGSLSWRDAFPGRGGPPDLGSFLGGFSPRAAGAQR